MSRSNRSRPQALAQALLIVSTLVGSWLAMMVVHELGHVVHAWLSGGRVTKVVLHPLAISRTDISPNPSPNFVAWGGAIWGCLLPLLARQTLGKRYTLTKPLLTFFAGFCLVANGAYLAVGGWFAIGDARDLLATGTSKWLLLSFGLVCVPCGFWLWNGLGPAFGLGSDGRPVQARLALTVLVATIVLAGVELLLSSAV